MKLTVLIGQYPGRLTAALLALLIGCTIIACNPDSNQPETAEFSDDEAYLIDAYVEVKRARSFYPYQESIADSLFAGLSASIDTVRIARTIAALNLTPDRWADVYRSIEEHLREIAMEKELKRSGARPGTPAQVQKNDEHH